MERLLRSVSRTLLIGTAAFTGLLALKVGALAVGWDREPGVLEMPPQVVIAVPAAPKETASPGIRQMQPRPPLTF